MADKYDDLFDFYIKLYDDEIARFRELDSKIARYLSAYSILIALTGFVGINLRFLLNDSELNFWVILNYICLALVLLLLVPGWYYLISALKLENLQRFAYDSSVIDFFSKNETINIKYALSHRAKEAIEYNVAAGDRKSEKIAKAFKWSFPAMALFVGSLLLAMFNVYFASNIKHYENETIISNSNVVQPRSSTMSEQNQNNSNTSQQPKVQSEMPKQTVPNPNVQAPQNVLITEGYEPPKSKVVEQK